jgi:hypothetical protein
MTVPALSFYNLPQRFWDLCPAEHLAGRRVNFSRVTKRMRERQQNRQDQRTHSTQPNFQNHNLKLCSSVIPQLFQDNHGPGRFHSCQNESSEEVRRLAASLV